MAQTPRVDVPTMDEFNALKQQVEDQGDEIDELNARVTALEGGETSPPVDRIPSPDGTEVTDTSGEIIDDQGRCFRLVGQPDNYRIDCDGAISGGGVIRLYALHGLCYQENVDHDWWFMGEDDWVACENPTGEEPPKPIEPTYNFSDEFTSLELWNRDAPNNQLPWRPTRWYSPDEWDGWSCNSGRMVNPYKQTGCWSLYGVNQEGQLFLGIERHQAGHGDCAGNPFVTSQINQLSAAQWGGYWEARIKCPRIPGTNTAFWLMNNQSWPPEVDIVEFVQFTDGTHCMAQNLWHIDHTTNPYYDFGADPAAWHTYGFWWDTDNRKMVYFMDGKKTQECAQPQGYDHPMFVILSMQQGGSWSGPIPNDAPMGQMLVDYVRVSSTLPGALQSAPQAAPSGRLRTPRPLSSALGYATWDGRR